MTPLHAQGQLWGSPQPQGACVWMQILTYTGGLVKYKGAPRGEAYITAAGAMINLCYQLKKYSLDVWQASHGHQLM